MMKELKNKKRLSREEKTEPELSYFGVQAYWGVSKPHMGGFKATQELINLCHIDEDKYVLDVGCGVGVTPCYIAKKYGCKVVGVDTSKSMINRAKERAKREEIEDKVEFKIGDAKSLPFKDNLFDIVIGESVIAFLEDKQKGINEYVRVAKPNGYIGFNEATWLKARPPTKFIDYISRVTGAKFETSSKWERLLRNSGLEDVEGRTYKISAISQFIDEIGYIGLSDFLKGSYKFLSLYIKSSDFRQYLKEARPPKDILKDYYEYLGYGLYVGRKK